MLRPIGHAAVILALTVVTQLGGLAWFMAIILRPRLLPGLGPMRGNRLTVWFLFPLTYLVVLGAVHLTAPLFGRVALPCTGNVLRMQSPFYCAAMRNFVTPPMARVAQDAAVAVAADWPGTVTLALDGSFPFGNGIPLLPHLSHDDGEKLDFAFAYADPSGAYVPGATRSPLGYFTFERIGAETCPPEFATLRWDMAWFRPLLREDLQLEPQRTAALIRVLMRDPQVGRLFVEPALAAHLGVSGTKLGFQGCRAARHDDHLHVQLAP
jgi:hypothetical protein